MTIHVRARKGLAIAIAGMSCAAAQANNQIALDLRPSAETVQVGQTIGVRVFARQEAGGGNSFVGLGENFNAIDLFFTWNPQDLRLTGLSSAGAVGGLLTSQFPSPAMDYTGTNEVVPPADGTGYYSALALVPVAVNSQGVLVTTLTFEVLREFASTTVAPLVSVPNPPGSVPAQQPTAVYEGLGYDSTGSLNEAVIRQGSPCPADLDGGGDVESYDLSILLAAWGTVNSPANLDRSVSSPTVDGVDLGILLAGWGPCPD